MRHVLASIMSNWQRRSKYLNLRKTLKHRTVSSAVGVTHCANLRRSMVWFEFEIMEAVIGKGIFFCHSQKKLQILDSWIFYGFLEENSFASAFPAPAHPSRRLLFPATLARRLGLSSLDAPGLWRSGFSLVCMFVFCCFFCCFFVVLFFLLLFFVMLFCCCSFVVFFMFHFSCAFLGVSVSHLKRSPTKNPKTLGASKLLPTSRYPPGTRPPKKVRMKP